MKMRVKRNTMLMSLLICVIIITVLRGYSKGLILNRYMPYNIASFGMLGTIRQRNLNSTNERQMEVTEFPTSVVTKFPTNVVTRFPTNATDSNFLPNCQRTIPKLIHQIWNDDVIPTEFVTNIQGLVMDNPPPEWRYYFWTKEAALKFIQNNYPFLHKRASMGTNLRRADIVRTLVIHKYGGVYFDLDTISVKPLDAFVDSHQCALALEPGEHFFGNLNLISNGAMFCACNHSFYAQVIKQMDRMSMTCTPAFKCTGPSIWTRLYNDLNRTTTYTEELPHIESSELFQDVYDYKVQDENVEKMCSGKQALTPHQENVCNNWIARGKRNRTLSDKAYTYHTWYHVGTNKFNINSANRIKTIVPHAKIYGIDF